MWLSLAVVWADTVAMLHVQDGPCQGQHDCVGHHYVQGLSKETDFVWKEKLKSARKRNTVFLSFLLLLCKFAWGDMIKRISFSICCLDSVDNCLPEICDLWCFTQLF